MKKKLLAEAQKRFAIITKPNNKDAENDIQKTIINNTLLRSMMKARYCEENLGHFGLAADYYCHFTSPIRRYPDLLVHRILKEWLKGDLDEWRITHYNKITRRGAEQSTQTEIDATMAERDYDDFMCCEYMEDKIGQEFTGIISSVTDFGFFVELPNTVEGLVRMVDLADDYYGQLDYQMQYKDVLGEPFDWLYVDFSTLEYYAAENGFKAELILEGAHYEYLARVTCQE